MSWINTFGMAVVLLLLLPNIIYAFRHRDVEPNRSGFAMNLIEQVGRYGSMFLMAFNIGIVETGFRSKVSFLIWFVSMAVFLVAYWICWMFYFHGASPALSLVLAIIPSLIFLSSGLLTRNWLLLPFAVLFAVGHIYVTYRNTFCRRTEELDTRH